MKFVSEPKLCGLIGYPLGYSLSPVMHNAAFESLGLEYIYLPFKVKSEDLKKAIEGARALNIRGLNVTIPHKVAVLPLLDELDVLAQKIGAVNTIVNSGGILKGYNTDAGGFLKPLLLKGVELSGKKVVVLGAGGSSRAISFILAQKGANLIILNRTFERAIKLAQIIEETLGRRSEALPLDKENLSQALAKADILVNTTSIGMTPHIDESPVPAELLKPGLLVYDIVYNPLKTRLLKEAEKAGAEIIPGFEMLLWQGASSFKLWTGIEAPVEVMRKALVSELEKDED